MNKLLLFLSVLLLSIPALESCSKKRGCTDPAADNFDSEAKEDDDTCIPKRLKFLGVYNAHGTSNTDNQSLSSHDQVGLSILESADEEAANVFIGLSNFDLPFYTLQGTVVSQYKLMINRQVVERYTYWGEGRINGRVLELTMTRIEKIVKPNETTAYDTLHLNLYGLQAL
ncbi:hypothetical protein ACFLR1_03925 [Bacteroidota bacterium]